MPKFLSDCLSIRLKLIPEIFSYNSNGSTSTISTRVLVKSTIFSLHPKKGISYKEYNEKVGAFQPKMGGHNACWIMGIVRDITGINWSLIWRETDINFLFYTLQSARRSRWKVPFEGGDEKILTFESKFRQDNACWTIGIVKEYYRN